ncbi:PREDICTED: methionyl-tRNA formyltransferase, mitochondrial-like [Priapulus caudatus]|uniref:Methionyl-tRNA formyltransferase, mitochondrial n=1 Tax=Priapulus caudatus TaxID=37621 RepID=A0ABM1F5X5_PRICU|nr:PREDICTED: methionyl-tRNA formyltransferase, mitochondrial-like [Priapulus caudatus]
MPVGQQCAVYRHAAFGRAKGYSSRAVYEPNGQLPPSCVRQFAIEQGLKIHDWPHSVPMNRYDVGIIVSFGHLIPPATIESFPWGMLNVHPSALPRWRGAAPVNHTILAGDTHAAVTIMQIQPRFDVGPVLKQEIVPVPENCMASKLRQQLAQKGAMMLVDCLEKLPSVVANAKAQSKEGITQAPKLTASMSAVNFCVNTKNDINIRYRALSETFPLHCLWNREPVKLYNMLPLQQCDNLVVESGGEKPPGSSFYHKCRQLLCIKCKDGWVAFGGICPLGKKQMTAKEFYNGFLSKAKFNSVLFTT